MDSNEPEPLMDIEKAAKYTGLAVNTIYNKVAKGEMPHSRMGRLLRFRKADLDAWIVDHPVVSPSADSSVNAPSTTA